MKPLLRRLLATAAALLALPAGATPAVQHPTVGNVTSASACIAWDFTESAAPGLEVFSDAAATQNVTDTVRIEIQALEQARRELAGSTPASRSANRDLQAAIGARKLAFIRLSGLQPATRYFLRPLALSPTDTVLATGPLTPLLTARSAAFVPESRQLVAELAALLPTTGTVNGALLIASHAQAAYPLIAVVGDTVPATQARFDLTLLLDAAGETSLLPAAGPLALSLSWLGLPEVGGVFQPGSVPFTGATTVAAATNTEFVGQGFVLHATPDPATAVAGIPLYLDLWVTNVANQVQTGFNRPLTVEAAGLSFGAGATAPLAGGTLNDHLLIFSSPGTRTVTVRDSASPAYTTFDIQVLPMNYQNWRNHYLGSALAGGAPGDNPEADPFPNFVEYVHVRNPRLQDAAILGAARDPGKALTVRFDLNPLQRDYRVVVQVSPDMAAWRRSAKVPQAIQALPGYDVMEVSWTAAELQAETGTTSRGYFARLTWEPATNFASWLTDHALSGAPAAPAANPDGDKDPNFVEFALDSDPTSAAASGKVRQSLVRYGATFAQVLTFPMRLGARPAATDPPGGELVFEADGLRYRVQGTANLASWNLEMTEVPALSAGMPALTPGYEYRSFRSPGSASYSFEFTRVQIEPL